MCRMAIFGGMQEFKPLARGLNQLERSMGGDGNGFYNSELDLFDKGIKLSTAEIAFDTYESTSATMFHTRYATAGGTQSKLNHPFGIVGGALMHNGHWSYWYDYAINERSDTATAARLVSRYGAGVLLDRDFEGSGVWVVHEEDRILVIPRGWRDFYFQFPESGGFFHASEVISGIKMASVLAIQEGEIYAIDPETGEVTLVDLHPVEIPDEEFQFTPKVLKKHKSKKRNKKSRKAGEKSVATSGAAFGSEDDESWEAWEWLAEKEADERAEKALQDYEEKALAEMDGWIDLEYNEDFFDGIATTDFDA